METPQKILRNENLAKVAELSTPIKIPATPLLKRLGFGTGVNVFKFIRSPIQGEERSPWAIKRVSKTAKERGQDVFDARLKSEAEILRKLSHPNIIGFRALIKTQDGSDSLAIECCNTCLGSVLEDRLEDDLGPLPVKQTMKMIVDILNALDYLHETAHLLHGDIKSYNILVDEDFKICKLCDFGVSLPLDENKQINMKENTNLEYIGTELWSAPEVIDCEDIICYKADIFSFGLVLYETISLTPPHTIDLSEFSNCENNLNKSEDELGFLYGTRPPLPEEFNLYDEYEMIISIFYVCTNQYPENRPSAKDLLIALAKSEK